VFSTLGTFGIRCARELRRLLGCSLDYQALPTINFSKFSIGTGMFSATARCIRSKASFRGAGFGYLHYFLRLRSDIDAEARVGCHRLDQRRLHRTQRLRIRHGRRAVIPLKKMRAKVTAKPGESLHLHRASSTRSATMLQRTQQCSGQDPILVQLNLVRHRLHF